MEPSSLCQTRQHRGSKNDAVTTSSIAAAKVHVLDLSPLQEKLGERWPRLSGLVQQLFEAAIKKAQGPRDHFVKDGELSYVATFHGFSPEETALACIAIATEVCERLFGEDLAPVSVRSVVGQIPLHLLPLEGGQPNRIAAELERTGAASIVSRQPAQSEALPPVVDPILHAQRRAASIGYKFAFAAVADLRNWQSRVLSLQAIPLKSPNVRNGLGYALQKHDLLPELEMCSLQLVAHYSQRLKAAGQLCGLVVGVSYETLAGFKSRINYIQSLRAAPFTATNLLFIKIENVPCGAPLARLAELVAMLEFSNVRAIVEFAGLKSLPRMNLRLGAAGIGVRLSPATQVDKAYNGFRRLGACTASQVFSFVEGLDDQALVEAAQQGRVNLGTGVGLSPRLFDPEAKLPTFPVTVEARRDETMPERR